ncbi:MAG: N-acetyl-1-D-myo-inositol-2-amino-2-deoxy-alpha-D-glucopyranoside deacetylase [Nocardioidaceae bacterium]
MAPEALPARRLLLVHAHPDDESIANGVTMAKYASEGVGVTLVTCTLGEEGEVLVDSLAHLAADREDGLGRHRIGELGDAMTLLGVADHRFLGGPGHFRDTGMSDSPDGGAMVPETVRPDSFWAADLREAADLLVSVIREVRPQVLVTYDEYGSYGHPDHVQAHRVAMYGSQLAGISSYRPDLGEPWRVQKVYWNAMAEGRLREGLRALRASGDTTTFEGMDPDGPLPPFVTPDELVTTDIDGHEFIEAKLAAMRAHATQITVDGPFFALSNNVGNRVWSLESYRLVQGDAVPDPTGEAGRESDLFAGVD